MKTVKFNNKIKVSADGRFFKGNEEIFIQPSTGKIYLNDSKGKPKLCNPELLQLLANDIMPEKIGLVPRFHDGNKRNISIHNLFWGEPEAAAILNASKVDPLTPEEHEHCVLELMKRQKERPTKSSLALLFECSITRITRCEKEAKKRMDELDD